MLCGCATAADFDLFHPPALARGIRIGIIVWPRCRGTSRRNVEAAKITDVQTLLDAALRQQLQGSPCAGASRRALRGHRGGHPARREPYPRIPRKEPERTGEIGRAHV